MNKRPRILLIRTLEAIGPSTEYLQERNVDVVPVPLLQAKKLEVEPALVRQRFNDSDLAICLSQNAATSMFGYQGMTKPMDIYAIGNRTGELLKTLFDSVHIPQEQTSEGVFSLLNSTRLASRSLLIIKGVGGRNWLQPRLEKAGARIQTLDLYERTPYSPTILKQVETISAIDAIFVTSGELLLAATQRLGNQFKNHLWFVPGDRIKTLAKQQGINRCINVGSASTASMYTAFKQEVE